MEFTDTEFMTARDKQLTANQFRNFIDKLATCGNCKETQLAFSRRVYNHLHLHCRFIAHYDIGGFYRTYFNGDVDDYRCFAGHFVKEGKTTPPQYTADFEDINQTFSQILAEKHKEILTAFSTETKQRDLEKGQNLIDKWK